MVSQKQKSARKKFSTKVKKCWKKAKGSKSKYKTCMRDKKK